MSRRSPVFIGVAVGLLIGVVASLAAVRLSGADVAAPPAPKAATAASTYLGDPELEAQLVQLESQRLVYVRTVAATANWNPAVVAGPFRVQTGATYTLVLTARSDPYTVDDLTALAPDTFQKQPDGGYLLSENIVVLSGATLALRPADDADTLRLLLKSDEKSFVSIVSAGGQLQVAGRKDAPVEIESWNAGLAGPDLRTTDGRAYLRVIGGRASLAHTNISDLGFWSGTTGGLSLTGTNDSADFTALLAQREADPAGTPGSPSETQETASAASTDLQAVAGAPTLATPASPEFPTEPAATPATTSTAAASSADPVPALAAGGLVSARIDHVTISGNAFGLFATSASGVVIRDSAISKSLIDGLVFHRHVTDSAVTRTSSTGNAVDGFSLARSSTGVSFTNVTADNNGRDGMALDGQPLATGPSATGTKVQEFGRNRVTASELADNGRYGIVVSGGNNITVSSNVVSGNVSGIVVDHNAADVHIVANRFVDQVRQAIALRDGVSAQVVTNRIRGGETAVYLRNAAATVQHNSITQVSNHGVTLVGDAGNAEIARNTIAGFGRIPIFDDRSTGGTIVHNDTVDWRPAPSFETVINALFQPLTLVWVVLGLLVLISALSPAGRRATSIRHPYAERAPLSTFTKGIVSRESIREEIQ